VAEKRHTYLVRVDWTGNQGTGTPAYRAHSRAHEISAHGKTAIAGSSNPVFHGDAARWNPAVFRRRLLSYTGATTRQRGGPHTDLVVVRPRAFAYADRGNAALAR
jgi:hypothetical protein